MNSTASSSSSSTPPSQRELELVARPALSGTIARLGTRTCCIYSAATAGCDYDKLVDITDPCEDG